MDVKGRHLVAPEPRMILAEDVQMNDRSIAFWHARMIKLRKSQFGATKITFFGFTR